MTADSETFPPPNSPDAFESLCLDLWKDIWGDSGAAKNGRSGQSQAGVDVYGQMNGQWIGVQCKQKDGLLRSKVTIPELEREVSEALKFNPKLSRFILATTGPSDGKVHERARELTDDHQSKGLFAIEVWSWERIWHELYGREELLRRIGPIYWPRYWRLILDSVEGAKQSKSSFAIRGVIPPPPQHYLPRAELFAELRQRLLANESGKVAIVGAGATVGVQGMGGVGKTVLAAAVAREPDMQLAFPDGVFWITIGVKPNLLGLLNQFASWLPDCGGPFTNEASAQSAIRDALAERRVLLVLDDVWQMDSANALNLISTRSALLITTRNREVLIGLGAQEVGLDVLSEPDALRMLADWAGVEDASQLPREANDVARECGRLPLALAMIGAMVQLRPTAWADALELLRNRDLEEFRRAFPNYPYPDLLRAIAVSVDELSDVDRKRYLELAIFPEDKPIPEAPLQVLWNLSPARTRMFIDRLVARSLASLYHVDGKSSLLLHDLQADYIRASAGERLVELHKQLLQAYREKCSDGWSTGPDDGYFFQQLRHHLVEAQQGDELSDLLLDLRWLESKNEKGLTFDLIQDFARAQQPDVTTASKSNLLALLDETLRREIHFITRCSQDYPNALFQSFWNACWWFDNPAADDFYEEPPLARATTRSNASEDRLYQLMERWRAQKEATGIEGCWLRSQRPPPIALGSSFVAVFPAEKRSINSVAYSPTGVHIATATENRTISVWDVSSQTLVHKLQPAERLLSGVDAVSFSPDGRVLASLDYIYPGNVPEGGVARLWDPATGEQLLLMHHGGTLLSIQFSPDGKELICTTGDGRLFAWDCSSGKISWRIKLGLGAADGLAVFPDGILVAATSGPYVEAWNRNTRSLIWKAELSLSLRPSLACSPDGSLLAATMKDGPIKVLDAQTGTELRDLEGHSGEAVAVVFSPDGNLIASAADDDTIRIWSAKSGEPLSVLRADDMNCTGLAFSPDSKQIAVAGGDGVLRIWRVQLGLSSRRLKGHSEWISSLAVSPDGKLVATTSDDATVRVWEVVTGKERFVFRDHTEWTRSANFSPDGKLLASGSGDLTIRIWKLDSGIPFQVLRDNRDWINSVAFSPDGRSIVSAASDRIVRLWDVATGRQLKTFVGHDGSVERVRFSVDGKRIISEEIDNEMWWHFARVWDVASGLCLFADDIENIPAHERQAFEVGLSSNQNLNFRDGAFEIKNADGALLARLAAGPYIYELIGLPKPALVFSTRKNLFIYSLERIGG